MAEIDRLAVAFESQELRPPDLGKLLFIRATPSDLYDSFDPNRVVCEQSFRPVHDEIAERYAGRGIEVTRRATGAFAMAVVTLTRARAENLGNVARALACLDPGGLLAVNGAKTDGIDSLARHLGGLLPIEGAVVKAHGRVIWLRRPGGALPPEIDAWADAAVPRVNAAGFLTAPGMFSPDGVDPASARLAQSFEPQLSGRVADLGAGWGWLAHRALGRCPKIAQLDLYEAEERALIAARANVTDPRAAFHWSDATTLGHGVPPYDAVITNPPFHTGRAAEPDLGSAFIATAARILKPSGTLLMVANRQLPYEAALEAHFRHRERVEEDARYKVIRATRPRRG